MGAMDDWRVTVDLADERAGTEFVEWLRDVRLEPDVREHLGERIAVSRDGARVFLYADTEERARRVERLVAARLHDSAAGRVELARWHPVEQRWEDAAVPLPRTEEEWRAEHERLQAREAAESEASGAAEWEVRIELPSHEATVDFADRLAAESIPVVRRHTFVLVGAVNEDEARALASRLAAEAPAGSRIEVEPGGQMVWEVAPQNPFVVFGGLGI
jgi:hypothetical protein